MASNHQTSMALIGGKGRLSDTAYKTTHAMEITTYQSKYHRTICSRRSSGEVSQCRNNRTLTNTEYRLPVQLLHNPGSNKMSPNTGLSKDKQLYSVSSLQDGRSAGVEGDNREKRFHMQIRPEGCVCRDSDPCQLEEILDVSKPRSGISIQNLSFRDEREPTCFQQIDEVCYRTFAADGHSLGLLSGRYLHSGIQQGGDTQSHQKSIVSFRKLRFFNKLPKECTDATSTTGVPRFYFRHKEYEDISPFEEGYKVNVTDQTGAEGSTASVQLSLVCQFDGQDDLNDTCHWRGITPHT
ncbi:hypothetical protein G6F43_013451 [Rhizopus delemar]|nr:hypothetical protein G6F43_013451 [Rhizopus delemar]